MRLIRILGIEPNDLASLRLTSKGVFATAFARGENGLKIILNESKEPAMHDIFIRFE